jgi:Ca2+-binding EF-hand superfamily protein
MLGAKLAGNMKLTNLEVDAIFAIGDKNKDGEIDIDEFMSVMRPSAGTMTVSSSSSSSFSSSFKSTSFQSSSVTSSSFSSSSSSSFCSVGMTFGSVNDAKMAFKRFDVNGDGVMDKTEMKDMMSSAAGKPVSDSEVNALFSKGDIDGDGQIDMQEFVKLMFPSSAAALSKVQKSYKSLDEVKSAFRKCDSVGDGHISLTELRTMMSGFSPAEVEAVFALGDKDLSGGGQAL